MTPLREVGCLLLAVSGGPDSTALMGLSAAWARNGRPRLEVATVDHALRPSARAEADAVGRLAKELGLGHAILEWEGSLPRTRLQETARRGRYALLTAHARWVGASHLATAHTLDDQAETILFRLARGSGPAGLVGMRPSVRRDGTLHVRPLLSVRKTRLVATCRASGWPFVEDPSNHDLRFARTRWRNLLAQLAPEGLGPERLAAVSQRLARVEEALRITTERAHAGALVVRRADRIAFDGRKLAAEPEEIFLRVLGQALADLAGPGDRPLRLQRLERLAADLQVAAATAAALKRTLAGAIVSSCSDGTVIVEREGQRRALAQQDRPTTPVSD